MPGFSLAEGLKLGSSITVGVEKFSSCTRNLRSEGAMLHEGEREERWKEGGKEREGGREEREGGREMGDGRGGQREGGRVSDAVFALHSILPMSPS